MGTWRTIPPRVAWFAVFAAAAAAAFAVPVAALARVALGSRLHSHVLLVPVISAWLFFRAGRPLPPLRTSWPAGALLLAAAAGLAAVPRAGLAGTDALTVSTLALLLSLAGGGLLFLGLPAVCARRFPLLFALFMVPMPSAVERFLSVALQDGSTALAHWTFVALGWPVYRHDYLLALPGLSMEVAEECSGINSTYALFITSVLAGWMLLRSGRYRALFVAVVLPLGILRNTFRIVSLAVLTLKVDPRIIDSPLHHQGGPIFFALSLVPLFALLVWLHRLERRREATAGRQEEP